MRGLPEYGFYTDVYQTERDGRVGGRVGSAAPPGFGEAGQGKPGAKQLPRAIGRKLLSL